MPRPRCARRSDVIGRIGEREIETNRADQTAWIVKDVVKFRIQITVCKNFGNPVLNSGECDG